VHELEVRQALGRHPRAPGPSGTDGHSVWPQSNWTIGLVVIIWSVTMFLSSQRLPRFSLVHISSLQYDTQNSTKGPQFCTHFQA
jgi:hypothetical protein